MCIYLEGGFIESKRNRSHPSIKLDRSAARASSRTPTWVLGTQELGPTDAALPATTKGNWIGTQTANTRIVPTVEVGTTGIGCTHYVTVPTPVFVVFSPIYFTYYKVLSIKLVLPTVLRWHNVTV